MASGSTSAQLRTPRPGKRWAPTSQASPTPSTTVADTTPTVRPTVVTIWSGSLVSHCCRHTSRLGRRTLVESAAIGIVASTAITTGAATHPGRPTRRRSAIGLAEVRCVHRPHRVVVQRAEDVGPQRVAHVVGAEGVTDERLSVDRRVRGVLVVVGHERLLAVGRQPFEELPSEVDVVGEPGDATSGDVGVHAATCLL